MKPFYFVAGTVHLKRNVIPLTIYVQFLYCDFFFFKFLFNIFLETENIFIHQWNRNRSSANGLS